MLFHLIIGKGKVTVDCGPGTDTLEMSRFPGNQKKVHHVNCEVIKKA